MMNPRSVAAGLAIAALAVSGLACGGGGSKAKKTKTTGTSLQLSAAMTPADVITPHNRPWHVPAAASKAKASLTGTVSGDGRTLRWQLAYSGLGRPVIVETDIHIGGPGKFGAILLRVCAHCRSGQSGVVALKPGYKTELASSAHWATVITDKYPNGIVRGQLSTHS